MLRGSFCWFIVTTPAEVAFRLVLGPPNRAELVPLKASARNCRFQVSCSLKALNMERSALGGMGGRRPFSQMLRGHGTAKHGPGPLLGPCGSFASNPSGPLGRKEPEARIT